MFQRLPASCLALACAGGLALAGLAPAQDADTLPTLPPPRPGLALPEAVGLALQRNPELAVIRQQHGIAAAAVVIARTYPFNPTYEMKLDDASGPTAAGILNRVAQEHKILLELELRHQGTYRRQAAQAALSMTDWDIANQEVKLAALVVRAFQTVLYRQEKLRLIEERVRLNEQAAEQIKALREAGKLSPADLLLIRSEVAAARSQRGPGSTSLAVAWADLRRALGVVGSMPDIEGVLGGTVPQADAGQWLEAALERRPDLRARRAAVAEAQAKLRLGVANRFGNPALGPVYAIDPTDITTFGANLTMPIPVLNVKRGEILQLQAEQVKATLEVRSVEVQIRQDVQAALARLTAARAGADLYDKQLLPILRDNLAAIEKLFAAGEPGVDALKVIEVRRNLLNGRDAYLDALWEVGLARADLVAAVGDPLLVLLGPSPCAPAGQQPPPDAPPAGPTEKLPPPQVEGRAGSLAAPSAPGWEGEPGRLASPGPAVDAPGAAGGPWGEALPSQLGAPAASAGERGVSTPWQRRPGG
jgi:cobalt-zinc-cadmium efflux system outer membrane protein